MLTLMVPLKRTPPTRAFQRHSAFPPCGTRPNPTVIQIIRQLKRKYFRHLKKMKQRFTSITFIARHAYDLIDLAVKSKSAPIRKRTCFLWGQRQLIAENYSSIFKVKLIVGCVCGAVKAPRALKDRFTSDILSMVFICNDFWLPAFKLNTGEFSQKVKSLTFSNSRSLLQ